MEDVSKNHHHSHRHHHGHRHRHHSRDAGDRCKRGHRSHRSHKQNGEKSGDHSPHSDSKSNRKTEITETPRNHNKDKEGSKIPVSLETVSDSDCPPRPITFVAAQYESPSGKHEILLESSVSIPIRVTSNAAITSQPETSDAYAGQRGHTTEPPPAKIRAFRNLGIIFNGRHYNRKVNGERKSELAMRRESSRIDSSTLNPDNEHTLAAESEISIPLATLVEEDTFTRQKWNLLVLFLTVLIIAIGIGIGVALSRNKNDLAFHDNEDGGLNEYEQMYPTQKETREKHNYNLWISPYEKGNMALYYGAECSKLSFSYSKSSCSRCGVYLVDIDTSRVVGKCERCRICDSGFFEIGCDNIGFGRTNCNYTLPICLCQKD